MSAISPAVTQTLQARQDAMQTKIDTAIMGQQLDAQQQTGDAINEMLRQVVQVQEQLSQGYIDVKV